MQLLISFGVLLFALRPISGLIIDAIKVILRLSLAGLILMLIPLDFIDSWSKQAVGWTHVTATYVPVIALFGLIALSTANLVFLSGTRVEEIVKVVFYIVGGVFTVGNSDWVSLDRHIGGIVIDVVGAVTSFFTMLGNLFT